MKDLSESSSTKGARNVAELRNLIWKYRISRTEVARLSGYSISAVNKWLLRTPSKEQRIMPDRALDLLKLRLRQSEAA